MWERVNSSSRIQRKTFSEMISVSVLYQKKSAVTNVFNYPNEDYSNFISIDSSNQMMKTRNDDQNNGK